MKRALVPVVLAVASVSLSGCGTVCNFAAGVVELPRHSAEWAKVYGGLEFDKEAMSKWGCIEGEQALPTFAFMCTEMTASFLGDTLTLPITIPIDMARYPEKYRKHEKAPAPPPPPPKVIYNGPPQYSVNGPGAGDVSPPSEPGKP